MSMTIWYIHDFLVRFVYGFRIWVYIMLFLFMFGNLSFAHKVSTWPGSMFLAVPLLSVLGCGGDGGKEAARGDVSPSHLRVILRLNDPNTQHIIL